MKYYTYRVYKNDRDWSVFVILLRKENFNRGENLYEIHSLFKSDFFNTEDVPCIGLFGMSEREILEENFPGYKIKKIGEHTKENLVKERMKYILSEKIDRDYALEYWNISNENLTRIENLYTKIKIDGMFCNRWEFETFLYKRDLITKRQLSVDLGLSLNSFEQLLDFIKDENFCDPYLLEYLGLFSISFTRHLMSSLFPNDYFSSKNVFLKKLYTYMRKEGLCVANETCFISNALKERSKKHPAYIDIVFNQPVSEEYSVSIKNGKPGFLPPDRISFYTYLLNDDVFSNRKITISQKEFEDCLNNIKLRYE
jgi:hypothetical protein